jgi:hypothetical protein
MKTPILLLATEAASTTAARLPRALDLAGLAVSLLAPAGSLAEKSRHIARIGPLPPGASAEQWLYGFAATAKGVAPRLVVPCDNGSLQRLLALLQARPPAIQPALLAELQALIRASLGDLSLAAAAAHADTAAGDAAKGDAFRGGATNGDGPNGGAASGDVLTRVAVAWRGRELAGITRVSLAADAGGGHDRVPADAGGAHERVPAVARYLGVPEARAVSSQAIAQHGLTGFCSIAWRRERDSGQLTTPAIRRHPTPDTHMAALAGIDLAAALHAALDGRTRDEPDDLPPGEEHVIAEFPQEWRRDPASRWLRDSPVDAPWDEPELFAAMLE